MTALPNPFFARFAALRPSNAKSSRCGEQLRASLRRKELCWWQYLIEVIELKKVVGLQQAAGN